MRVEDLSFDEYGLVTIRMSADALRFLMESLNANDIGRAFDLQQFENREVAFIATVPESPQAMLEWKAYNGRN